MAKRKAKRTNRNTHYKLSSHTLPELQVANHTVRDIKAVVLFAIGVILLLALFGNASVFGTYFILWATKIVGIGIWLLPFFCFILGALYIYLPSFIPTYTRIFGLSIIFVSFLGMVHLNVPIDISLEHAQAGQGGGIVGFTVSFIFQRFLGKTATGVLFFAFLVVGILVAFDVTVKRLGNLATWFLKVPEPRSVQITIEDAMKAVEKNDKEKEQTVKKSVFSTKKLQQNSNEIIQKTARKTEKQEDTMEFTPFLHSTEGYKVPDIELLETPGISTKDMNDQEFLMGSKRKIVETLFNFKILKDDFEGFVIKNGKEVDTLTKDEIKKFTGEYLVKKIAEMEHNVGPTVTQFAFEPPAGVKLSRITALQNDLALALAAQSLRLEAPIPGQSKVGIEVPNNKRADVFLKEMLLSNEFRSLKGDLKIPIGQNVSGKPIIADLAEMPHLLIAGATGAGKSVGINAILLSFLFTKSPDDLKLILVDPKRVELTNYNNIPHLLTPVITESDKTVTALRWAVAEMNRRYKVLEEGREKNIVGYNKKYPDKKLPFIVIVVDELADLMMVAAKEVEASICRIAQLARAVGIHLIVATQRPSVDVITGLIKANIPSRVAYTVSAGIDSRTILDTVGAEKLLGKGDMLYLDRRYPKPVRLQGVFVSNQEIQRVIGEIRLTSVTPEYQMEIVEEKREIPEGIPGAGTMGVLHNSGQDDDLEREAIDVLLETKKASASLLQRRLRVGYARAARMLDILEEKGYIGPSRGAKPREIYIEKNPYSE